MGGGLCEVAAMMLYPALNFDALQCCTILVNLKKGPTLECQVHASASNIMGTGVSVWCRPSTIRTTVLPTDPTRATTPGLCAFSAYGLSPIDFAYGLRVPSAALGGYI